MQGDSAQGFIELFYKVESFLCGKRWEKHMEKAHRMNEQNMK